MLLNLKEYHRPASDPIPERSFDRVLTLLARPEVRTVVLAGGDTLLASADDSIRAVVDLQSLDLNHLAQDAAEGALRIGAMVTRAALAQDETACGLSSGVLSEGAGHWGGNVQRNRATVGGAVVVAQSNDPLLLALLACDTTVRLYTQAGYLMLGLADFLSQRSRILATPALVVELRVPLGAPAQRGALAYVARTASDAPIVAAYAVVEAAEGRCVRARLALGGVADLPLIASGAMARLSDHPLTRTAIAEAASLAARDLTPPGDYRGSSEYRRAMAEVLSTRVLRQAAALTA